MANWMKRRIERSRARCERAATHKSDKDQEAAKQPKLAAVATPGAAGKDD